MVYLDYCASTPLDPAVFEAMRPWFSEECGNPATRVHEPGRRASDAVEEARARVAAFIGARPHEIVFTSGATESNNLAILGTAGLPGPRAVSALEHPSVLGPAGRLPDVTPLKPDRGGHVGPATLAGCPWRLVSVMAVSNEVGTVQDIAAIRAACPGAILHTDAAQAPGRIPIDVGAWGVDLLSLSAHKVYGPKGVGALFVRNGRLPGLEPRALGGGQEGGLRPGTLNVPGIVGMGEACRLAAERLAGDWAAAEELSRALLDGLQGLFPGARRLGAEPRAPQILSLAFPGREAAVLLLALDAAGLAAATGAACSSTKPEPSPALLAMGEGREARSVIRLSLGRFTTRGDIDAALDAFRRALGGRPPPG